MFGFTKKADAAKVESAIAGLVDALTVIAMHSGSRALIASEIFESGQMATGERRSVLMELAKRLNSLPAAPSFTTGERLDTLMNRFDN